MLLEMAADGLGDRVVVGPKDSGITAERLRQLARGGAAAVVAAGADALLYLASNGPAFPVAMFAAAYAGVPLIPVNYRLGEAQLQQLLAKHPGAFAVADAGQSAAMGRAGITGLNPVQWLEVADRHPHADPTPEDSPAVLIYTSGTTSAPKGVVLRHENLVSYVLAAVEFASAGPDEAALMSVPPYHIAAVANVITNLYAGRRVLTLESFTPAGWLELVRRENVTNALVVPTMLTRVMEEPGLDLAVPTLRVLAYGGAQMPSRVVVRALEAWPDVDFVNAYGLTETSSTIAVLGPEEHRTAVASTDPVVRARLGSAGRAVPAVELEIRDEAGRPVAPGVTGRIWVRGPQVSGEYTGSGPALDERGFFDTRDEGFVDEDDYLFIGGRTDDTIIRGGENIAPAEIEDVLLAHPMVSDAVVVGVPDEEWGQRLEAAVVARPGAEVELDELKQFAKDRLRGSKTPVRIVLWEALPRTDTGKLIRRHALERLLAETATPQLWQGAQAGKL
ncbi:MAG: hypothetical protein QOG99_743 [Frankiales bacterium]|jgi:acyl-CoA synthetase (AMP-forming)/AMP-acid ligase II|nr:hypothetical protein [Frankiales bacterium]